MKEALEPLGNPPADADPFDLSDDDSFASPTTSEQITVIERTQLSSPSMPKQPDFEARDISPNSGDRNEHPVEDPTREHKVKNVSFVQECSPPKSDKTVTFSEQFLECMNEDTFNQRIARILEPADISPTDSCNLPLLSISEENVNSSKEASPNLAQPVAKTEDCVDTNNVSSEGTLSSSSSAVTVDEGTIPASIVASMESNVTQDPKPHEDTVVTVCPATDKKAEDVPCDAMQENTVGQDAQVTGDVNNTTDVRIPDTEQDNQVTRDDNVSTKDGNEGRVLVTVNTKHDNKLAGSMHVRLSMESLPTSAEAADAVMIPLVVECCDSESNVDSDSLASCSLPGTPSVSRSSSRLSSDGRAGKYNKRPAPARPESPPDNDKPVKARLVLQPGVVRNLPEAMGDSSEVFLKTPKSKKKKASAAGLTSMFPFWKQEEKKEPDKKEPEPKVPMKAKMTDL